MNLLSAYALLLVAVLAGVHAELKSVAVLFRHGERTPTTLMASNYGDSVQYRELGPGMLTLTGSRQLYDIGVDLRNRYGHLLPSHGFFRDSNMRVLSSSVPRCIVSLESFMAGFMPPPVTDRTIPFRWQAFPFAVDNEARILTLDPRVCPKYLAELTAAQAKQDYDPLVKEWLAADSALLKTLSGYVGQSLTTFEDAGMAAETIRTQQFLDPSTPAWVVQAYEQLKKYFVYSADMYHGSDLMKKVRGGPMITEIIDNMNMKRDGNATAKNLIIYSAHDFTLVSLLSVLNLKSQAPDVAAYGDTVAIEMHQTGTAEPEVKIFYISNTLATKFKNEMFLSNCGTPCKLSTFNSIMSKWIVRDFEGMCGITK